MNAIRLRVSTFLALIALLLVLAGVSLSGCGVSSASSSTCQIWGDVTFNGQPVPDGTIIFMPADRNLSNWGAGAIHKGKYVVGSWQSNGVLQPGSYTIFFRFNSAKVVPRSVEMDRSKGTEESTPAGTEATNVAAAPESSPLDKFTQPDTSGLTVNLRKEPSRIDIRLKG
jgi:hypothetical protein